MALIIYLAIKVLLLLVEAINLNTVCVKRIAANEIYKASIMECM